MDVSQLNLPKPLAQLYTYWMSKCAGRTMPARSDINPSEMRDFLHHTMLLDVLRGEDSSLRYRLRLVGTHAVAAYGIELTGKFHDEIDLGAARETFVAACDKTVIDKEPVYLKGSFRKESDSALMRYERLGVPLSTDGTTVDMILVAIVLQRTTEPEAR